MSERIHSNSNEPSALESELEARMASKRLDDWVGDSDNPDYMQTMKDTQKYLGDRPKSGVYAEIVEADKQDPLKKGIFANDVFYDNESNTVYAVDTVRYIGDEAMYALSTEISNGARQTELLTEAEVMSRLASEDGKLNSSLDLVSAGYDRENLDDSVGGAPEANNDDESEDTVTASEAKAKDGEVKDDAKPASKEIEGAAAPDTDTDTGAEHETEEVPEIDVAAVKAKRNLMVKEGLSALEVGNMSNQQIANYNLVERESAEVSEAAEGAKTQEGKDTLPGGHVEYDGKQWEVVDIKIDDKTGERSFHLVHTDDSEIGAKIHETVAEAELNLAIPTGQEDDSIDSAEAKWAGRDKNTDFDGELNDESIDPSDLDWIDQDENSDDKISDDETAWVDQAVAERDEAVTVDTRGKGRRLLDRLKYQYRKTVIAGGGNAFTGAFLRLKDYAPERREAESDDQYEKRRRNTKVAMGAGVAALLGVSIYGIAQGLDTRSGGGGSSVALEGASNAFDAGADLGTDSPIDGSQVVPVGGEAGQPERVLPLPGEADGSPAGAESAAAGAGSAEAADFSEFDHPWNWAASQYGENDAMAKLLALSELARADGLDVEWHNMTDGDPLNNWVSINGESGTEKVLQTLTKYDTDQ